MDEAQVVAARIVKAGETEAEKPDTDSTAAEKATAEVPHQKGALNAIVLADLDMFSNVFFQLHSRGGDVDGDGLVDQRFDNVTFLLSCIGTLAGDESFIELRSRQPEFRRLTLVDQSTKDARDRREAQITAANSAAEDRLATAQASLDAKVAEVE